MSEEKNPGGRPTTYKKEYNKQVYKLCLLGATDKELADFLEVTEQTITNWKKKYPEFFGSIKRGKIIADSDMAESLFKRGKGFKYIEKKITYQVLEQSGIKEQVETGRVETTKYIPPDTGAAAFWLKNRRPKEWRETKFVEAKHDIMTMDIAFTPEEEVAYDKRLAEFMGKETE